MPFTARNARYLRVSAHTVLPLYIYIDEKHVEWLTDYTLQRVLENLRPVIGLKLRASSSLPGGSTGKKGTVDVHRGDTYQFAYFFRKTEPHAVLIKSRKFVHSSPSAQSSKTPVMDSPQPSRPESRKRGGAKSKTSSTKSVSRMRAKSKKRTRLSDSDEDEALEETGDGATSESAREGTARRSLRRKNAFIGGYCETEEDEVDVITVDSDHNPAQGDRDATEGIEGSNSLTRDQNIQDDTIFPDPEPRLSPVFDVDMEGEEEKPKLTMKVAYQGYTIYDRCLCLIVEPWPTLRNRSRVRSVAPSLPPDSNNPTELRERTPMPSIRERTPLFLPELDPRRSSTPAPRPSSFFLPPVPLFDDNDNSEPEDHEDDTDEGGMMAFSQALKSAGGERPGSEDEDENEGDVFLGDADERRGDL